MDLAQEDIVRRRALNLWQQLAEEPLGMGLGGKTPADKAGGAPDVLNRDCYNMRKPAFPTSRHRTNDR